MTSLPRVCVYGAGAVGGLAAARLIASGRSSVSVIARGEHLRAIRDEGIRVHEPDGADARPLRPALATDRPADLPAQDLVIVTLKAPSLPSAAADIASLLADGGVALFVTNGIPWWWPYRGAASPGESLPLLDPEGALWRHVTPERALGCVVYSINEVVAPGVVRHHGNNRWLVGEPATGLSDRLGRVVGWLKDGALGAEAVPDLRQEVWNKLLRNLPLNPVAALTRAITVQMAASEAVKGLVAAIAAEGAAVATAQGFDPGGAADAARRILDSVEPSSTAKASMLQDALASRPMEVEAIVGQVQRFAAERGVATPVIDVVLPLLRGLDASLRRERAPAGER